MFGICSKFRGLSVWDLFKLQGCSLWVGFDRFFFVRLENQVDKSQVHGKCSRDLNHTRIFQDWELVYLFKTMFTFWG